MPAQSLNWGGAGLFVAFFLGMIMDNRIDFKEVADAALNVAETLLNRWLPDGKKHGHEYQARNPTRADTKIGSFSINLNTGAWGDFATDETGGDLISLYAYLNDCSQLEAAKALSEELYLGVSTPQKKTFRQPENAPKTKEKDDDWIWVREMPENAPEMHKANPKRGRPVEMYRYLSENGILMGAVMRFLKTDGSKETLPHTLWQHKTEKCENGSPKLEWKWRVFPEPRPIYGLDALAKSDKDTPILIVEGEKCKDHAARCRVLDGYVSLSWSGGTGAVEKTDWTPIAGREVILWSDCDSQREKSPKNSDVAADEMPFLPKDEQPGMKAMLKLAQILHDLGCVVSMVQIPDVGILPSGYDIADLINDKNPPFTVIEMVENAVRWFPPTPTKETESENAYQPENQGAGDDNSVYNANFETLIKEFALIEGKVRGINLMKGIEYSRQGLIARFCRDSVDSWVNCPKKKVVTQFEANKIKANCERLLIEKDDVVMEALDRYIYLDGTTSVFDTKLFRIIDDKACQKAMTDEQYKYWKNSPNRKVIPIDNVVFEPSQNYGDTHINLFRGMEMQPDFCRLPENTPLALFRLFEYFPKCAWILELVLHLCNYDRETNENAEVVEWLLNWLAYPLQNLGAKMQTAVLMNSAIHGAGKSMLFDQIMRKIFGEYGRTFGQSDLESQYTGSRSGVMFGVFEEIFNNKQKYDHSGSIKHMVTGKTQRIERKFLDSYEEANYMNCVFLSNHIQPFLIEEYDRRFLVISPKNKLPENIKNGVTEEMGNGGVEAFYGFLMSLPLTLSMKRDTPIRFDAHTEALDTAARQLVIEWGLSGWQLFFRQWKNGEIDGVDFVSCLADDLYELFKVWTRRNGEKEIKRHQFLVAISTREGVERGRKRWRNLSSNCKEPRQQDIIKIGKQDEGVSEMDFLGETIIKFGEQVRKYRDKD